MNHYYDEAMDNCPMHEDVDTKQFYKLELIIPIGMDKPHAGWKGAASWASRFLSEIQILIEPEIQKVLNFRASVNHIGIDDDKTCTKYLLDHDCSNQ